MTSSDYLSILGLRKALNFTREKGARKAKVEPGFGNKLGNKRATYNYEINALILIITNDGCK